ncbi:MAG: carboxymuconolactone decarboxylase family protein [Phycisphaerales bacterium]|nr:MAG: carboxymuconolactone decarboxylase family protein [Phycisphaerales bacterium]
MLPQKQKEAFDAFYDSARHNTVLDEKTTVMIHMAVAMAVACYPCMEYYSSQLSDAGITDEELGVVQSIVMAVCGGRVNAQVQELLGDKKSE